MDVVDELEGVADRRRRRAGRADRHRLDRAVAESAVRAAAGRGSLSLTQRQTSRRGEHGERRAAGTDRRAGRNGDGGTGQRGSIPVENPATGEVIAHGPRPRRRRGRARWPRAARAAQPGWEALGFEGRGRDPAARAEVADRQRRPRHRDDRLRDRQDLRGRAARRDLLRRATRSASGPRTRRSTSPTRRSSSRSAASCKGKKLDRCATARSASIGVIGPWNYPLTNSFGDCIPALAAGNA